jgi:hypothetical protein
MASLVRHGVVSATNGFVEEPPMHDDVLVAEARSTAETLLGRMTVRWQHTQGVARRAVRVSAALSEQDRPVLVAAAWLHDIGYAEPLRRSGFHALDGADYLEERGWGRNVAGLVAHHSGAALVAHVLDLDGEMRRFPASVHATGPVADALTYADQTTAPDGHPVDVEHRLADMLRRHGPDSPNARCHVPRSALIRAAVARTCERLGRPGRGLFI